jgi:hypothetical protein
LPEIKNQVQKILIFGFAKQQKMLSFLIGTCSIGTPKRKGYGTLAVFD